MARTSSTRPTGSATKYTKTEESDPLYQWVPRFKISPGQLLPPDPDEKALMMEVKDPENGTTPPSSPTIPSRHVQSSPSFSSMDDFMRDIDAHDWLALPGGSDGFADDFLNTFPDDVATLQPNDITTPDLHHPSTVGTNITVHHYHHHYHHSKPRGIV